MPMLKRINFSLIGWISLMGLWAALTFSTALIEISFTISLICWILLKLQKRRGIDPIHLPLILALFVYLGLCILSYFWSEARELSGRGALKVFKHVMIFLMVADLFQESSRKRFFENFFIAVSLLIVTNGIFQYLVGYDFLRGFRAEDASAGLRISASFGSYGKLAAYLIATLPYLYFLMLNSQKVQSFLLRPIITIPVFSLSLVLLYWTRSRGAILAFAIGMVIALIFAKKFRYLLILLIAAAGVFMFIPRSTLIHLDAEGKEQSLVERYYLWDRAISVIKARPLTGTG
ncbi:MAG: O-antigen ligase family protein, partial [Candidatus Omnitrophica bacterium]|nr:O-antigen ligase family protein [Candidatus Omnitrophota bacterium]